MSRPIRVGEVSLLALLVVSLIVGAGVSSGGSGGVPGAAGPASEAEAPARAPAPLASQESQPAADNTVTRIEVAENGSARFSVRIRTRLETESDATEYRTFQESFRENTSEYLGPFRERIAATVAVAEDATGREMEATAFRASTSIQEVPRRWGVVTFSFRWEGIARQDGDALILGDIFQGGYYLTKEDTLEIQAPPGYEITETSPAPDKSDARTATWRGQEDFEDERPRARMEPPKTTTTTTTTTTPERESGNLPILLGGTGLVAVVAVGGYVLFRRQRTPGDGTVGEPDDGPPPAAAGTTTTNGGNATSRTADGGTTDDDGSASGPAAGATPETEPGGTGSDGPAAGGSGTSPTTGEDDDEEDAEDDETDQWFTSVEDPEVLTERERVLTLLTENGGRIKQGSIAEACDWSPSKTSRVISEMVDDGVIRKLRIGRENLIERAEDADGEDLDADGRDEGDDE